MLRVTLPGRPQQQVAYRYLLADSWYASAENMNLVRALGHTSSLPSNPPAPWP